MNRKERRARRHKVPATAHERNVPVPMLFKVQLVFADLDRILAELARQGTVDAIRGIPAYQDTATGRWYDTVCSIQGVIDFYDEWARRHRAALACTVLTQLAKKLKADMPLQESDIAGARAEVMALKGLTLRMTHDEVLDIMQTLRLREVTKLDNVNK
jgi:hypothetical protein